MTLGEALRLARKGARMTYDQAAELVGVDPVTIRRWEHGRRRPSDDTLVLLAQVYETRIVLEWHHGVRAYLDPDEPGAMRRVAQWRP